VRRFSPTGVSHFKLSVCRPSNKFADASGLPLLPVQAPVKYELVINLKTAKTLGLTISNSVIASAKEVIE
jgi:hypothetical protein